MSSTGRTIIESMMAKQVASASDGVYKTVAVFLAGVVLSGATSWFLYPRNAITKDDLERMMPALVMQNNPYSGDAKNISTQLQALHDEQVRQGAQINQIAVDVGRLSEKVGVTAHPAQGNP